MVISNNELKKKYCEQKWKIKNNIATCLDDSCADSLRTIDIMANEDKGICSMIIKNMYENQNQLYKMILKVTPSLMELIFKERYHFYLESNPDLPKSEITRYFLSQNDKWFLFVEEVKKITSEVVSTFGGLTLSLGARAEFPDFDVVDKVDRDNNFYIMIIGRYCKVPTLIKSHALDEELDFLHNNVGLSSLNDPKKENLLLLRNSYNNLLNRYGYFIGLTNKTSATTLITIYHWVQPFEINLQMLSDVSDFERDMCDTCLVALKEIQKIYTNILCRSFYCENNNIFIDSFLSKKSYHCCPNKTKMIDVFISKLEERVNIISETWNIPKKEISLDSVIDLLPWALQIEMLVYFMQEQKRYFWKYYVDCNKLENNVVFDNSEFTDGYPCLPIIFSFLKDIRNICAHSGVLMQSLILPTLSHGMFNIDNNENIIASNHRLKITELIEFRKIFGQSNEFLRIFKKFHLNSKWIFKDVTESSWPTLMNFILFLPFFVTKEMFSRWCCNVGYMIKNFYTKVYRYSKNKNVDVLNWKEACLTYTKNICSYLGIDELIDEEYLLELDLD